MNTPECNDNLNEAPRPDQLMSDAAQGFQLSHAFVRHDADHIRLGAAAMFEQGVGALLYEKLAALGLTDEQMEQLTEAGQDAFERTIQKLAPDEMNEIRRRIQVVAADPYARHALENAVYFTDKEFGRTKND